VIRYADGLSGDVAIIVTGTFASSAFPPTSKSKRACVQKLRRQDHLFRFHARKRRDRPSLNFLKNSTTIFFIRYTGSVRLRGEFIVENQADATNIFQAVNGLLAMGKLAGGPRQNAPDVTAVMNSIEVKQSANHVVVSVVVPQDLIKNAAQKR